MDALRFRLSGKTAFFKKPDVNSISYFSYGQIHKPALLGLFGAILGLDGYNQMKRTDDYPEFYRLLRNVSVSIEPCTPTGWYPRKMQTFNNSVGYASAEKGGNLIVKQQWLENPSWMIYLLLDQDKSLHLAEEMNQRRSKFVPYLGSNDHPADIDGIEVIKVERIDQGQAIGKDRLHSLVPLDCVDFDFLYITDDDEDNIFCYQESLPVAFDEATNLYKLKRIYYTNYPILSLKTDNAYTAQDKNLIFY